MELKKVLRTAGIIVSILAIIWLVANWSLVSSLCNLGFHIPVKDFVIFGVGYAACYVTKIINSETSEVQTAKAKGKARIESAKADMIERKKKANPVHVAKARRKADIASARAEALEA